MTATTYYAMTADEQLAEAQRTLDTHITSSANGRCLQCGTPGPCYKRETAVVIFSLATSSTDDLPRSVEFLYSLNRLNVAVSRARALVVLVCCPDLLRVRCRSPREMRLANALCRLTELARVTGDSGDSREAGGYPPAVPEIVRS